MDHDDLSSDHADDLAAWWLRAFNELLELQDQET